MKQLIISKIKNNDGIIVLTEKDYNYLITVRRMQIGQIIKIAVEDNTEKYFSAELIEIDTVKKCVKLKIVKEIKNSCNNKNAKIILMQWLIKNQKMDLVIRQAAETGVDYIFPVIGDFSVVKFDTDNSNKINRYEKIIKEARQQSGSEINTKICEPAKLEDVLKKIENYISSENAVYFMFSEKPDAEKNLSYYLNENSGYIILAIGCEGGISEDEKKVLKQNNFKTVHFNTNILRAETAALYSIASVQTILNKI